MAQPWGVLTRIVRWVRPSWLLMLSLLLLAITVSPDRAVGQKGDTPVANRPTTYLFFNLTPFGTYEIQKNSALFSTAGATAAGALSFADVSSATDRFLIVPSGVTPQPPSRPNGLTVQGDNVGCFSAAWNANPESDIIGYTIYWGPASVEQGQASEYDDSLVVTNITSRAVCGLATGTYYVAIRARNGFNMASARSAEVVAEVTSGSTQAPLPPQNVQAVESRPGCVTVSWNANSEPDIAGYWVYYGDQSVAQGGATQYAFSIDVSDTTRTEACSLPPGTHYFAVRAYNDGSEFSGYSTEREVNVVGVDTTPPTVSGFNPGDGQLQVALDTQIFFILTDAQTGVDTNSVTVTVDGTPVSSMRMVGADRQGFAVVCRPAGMLTPNSQVEVVVTARDLALPANPVTVSWRFTTGDAPDTDAPQICCTSPVKDARDVDPFAPVSFVVSDPGSGVYLDGIVFVVNEDTVAYDFEGDSGNAIITYANSGGFLAGSTVVVIIEARDLSSAQNTASLSFRFDVAAGIAQAASAPGEIVPDGYWADDASRPLEVRNIPTGWSVRIFDTAGLEVRRYTNDTGTANNWTWDFANTAGRRVARSLYLVRVIDSGGKVQRSGRFVVQLD